jgi:hypothetical protein
MMNEKVKSGYEEPVGKVQERLGIWADHQG